MQMVGSNLRLENDFEPQGDGWCKWSVWVEGSPEDLAGVESVTYYLHPTFPQPVVNVADAATQFKLSSVGWGEFAIAAQAHMKDGRSERLERWLRLAGAAATSATEERPSVFLSHSIADGALVDALSDALQKEGVEVKTAEQFLESGSDLEPRIGRQLLEADAVVALVSEPRSRFVEEEALTAHDSGRFVLPVVLGGATLSGRLATLARFELPDTANVEGLAQHIAARVMRVQRLARTK